MDFRHIEAGNPSEIHGKSPPLQRQKAQGTGADHDKFAAGADLGAGVIH